jgi:subtilase family serine protease
MPLRAVVEGRIKCGFGWALLVIALLLLPLRSWAQAGMAPGAATQARITAAIDESRLTTLRGNTHPLARPEFDQGAAPSSLPMRRMLLVLQRSPAQEAALAALLDQQQDKSSPNYRQWLTPAQMGQQFGPADQDIQTITLWLQSHGFQVAKVAQSRMVIEFSGTASQVLQAFHTQIHKYTVSGKDHWANASDPQIPMALAPVVAGIDSLHNFGRRATNHLAGVFARSKTTGAVEAVKPLFTFPGGCGSSPSSPCYALGPADFAKIYDVPNLLLNPAPGTVLNGDGITIAIAGESNINLQDVKDFRSMFGLPAKDPVIILDGPDPGLVSGVETEADLDVEWSGAVAPNATIDLVVAEPTETSAGIDLAAEHVIDNNLAPILSESFDACEASLGAAGNLFYSQLWQQAAAQGITVTISTGDSGAAGCDFSASFPSPAQNGLQISGIASTPYNVAVGGTDFNDLNNPLTYWSASNGTNLVSALGYIPEMTWNDSCTNSETFILTGAVSAEQNCNSASLNPFFVNTIGGSGGKSSCINGNGTTLSSCTQGYAKPTWQTGTGVPADSVRDIPDVSLFAADGLNGNFYIICESDATNGVPCSSSNFLGVGGTSGSTPSFAGIMALVNQKTAARQGNANYILYKLAASTPSAFHDVTTGTIAMPCAKGTLNCTINTSGDQYGVLTGYATTTGYDLATGLGSVDAANLVNAWASAAPSKPTTANLQLNGGTAPISITHGASVSVSITAAPTTPPGTPTGNVSLIANTGPSGQTGVQGATLSSGSASFNTTLLPGGSYSVFARYPGDGTFAASDSTPPVSVTVAKENSRLQIGIVTFSLTTGLPTSANATSFPYGSPYILRMDILNSSGNACQPVTNGVITGCAFDARGSVSVTDAFNGGAPGPLDAGTFGVNSEGSAEDQPIQLSAGTHNLSATYSGDASYNPPSGPSTVTLTVSKAPTATSVTSSVTSIGFGGTVTLTATIGSNSNSSAGPSGTVQFLNKGSNFGAAVPCTPAGTTATAGASCTATLITTTLPLGADSISAQYSGDANYSSSSTTASASVQILAATTTVVTTGAGATLWQGQSVTFTAKVTPTPGTGPAPTGTVQFTANAVSIGSGTLSGGQAQVTTSALPLGTVQIVAQYMGDSNNAASTSAPLTETVNAAYTVTANPTTITISAPGQSGSTTLTFKSLSSFAGSVTLSSTACTGLPAQSSCSFNPTTVNLTANGTATTTLTVATTAASLVVPGTGNRRTPLSWRNIPGGVAVTCFLLMILAALLGLGLRGTQRRWNLALGLAVFVLLVLNVGCGGGSGGGGGGGGGNPGTPVGTTIVSATSTINGVTQSVSLTVTVQ